MPYVSVRKLERSRWLPSVMGYSSLHKLAVFVGQGVGEYADQDNIVCVQVGSQLFREDGNPVTVSVFKSVEITTDGAINEVYWYLTEQMTFFAYFRKQHTFSGMSSTIYPEGIKMILSEASNVPVEKISISPPYVKAMENNPFSSIKDRFGETLNLRTFINERRPVKPFWQSAGITYKNDVESVDFNVFEKIAQDTDGKDIIHVHPNQLFNRLSSLISMPNLAYVDQMFYDGIDHDIAIHSHHYTEAASNAFISNLTDFVFTFEAPHPHDESTKFGDMTIYNSLNIILVANRINHYPIRRVNQMEQSCRSLYHLAEDISVALTKDLSESSYTFTLPLQVTVVKTFNDELYITVDDEASLEKKQPLRAIYFDLALVPMYHHGLCVDIAS